MDKFKLRSFTNPSIYYEIDRVKKTCTCKSFERDGYCKHLEAVGVYQRKSWNQSPYPTFSQALSALVKSIRIRRVEDAIYWLVYLDTFKQKDRSTRFRVARRLLIGSAEDGLSIAVMEKTSSKFAHLCKLDTHIIELAAEVVRICKVSNWWHPSTNGHPYIHECMIAARRRGLYHEAENLSLKEKLKGLDEGVMEKDVRKAMLMFDALMEHEGFTRAGLCEELMGLADQVGCVQAQRLLAIHAKHKGPLSGDANFLGQALWWMVGGNFPVENTIYPVMSAEVKEHLQRAVERWKNPNPIPEWCCDGIHCGGTDRRYSGMIQDMDALCHAYLYYGNVDPENEWLPEFYPLDGLEIAP